MSVRASDETKKTTRARRTAKPKAAAATAAAAKPAAETSARKITGVARGAGKRSLRVEMMARVEGEGAFSIRIRNGRVEEAELRIFEPPRFFEGFLRGRRGDEAPDITARICGICPVAYQMSSCHAIETALGVRVEGALRDLRRLLYCGEWIESHPLHIYLLHAPDFLGYPSALHMAADHGEAVERGLRLKKLGNTVLEAVGGRAVHPINVKVGGFYRAPTRSELLALRDPLVAGLADAEATLDLVASLKYPELERDYDYVALRHPSEYPMNEGRIVSTSGLDIPVAAFWDHFEEVHETRSHALHGRMRNGNRYTVGPLARVALNLDRLTPRTREAAKALGLGAPCRNPFRSIAARAVELHYAIEEALRLIEAYVEPASPAVPVPKAAGTGAWATEAPRGMLVHRYTLDAEGAILDARIVPPTSQNQPSIEDDLRGVVESHLDLDDATLTALCEQAVRNYDPCISCATHFLRLVIDRR